MYGVSLGPGDPDLVTLKAIKVLAEVDRIYYPATKTVSRGVRSLALEILQQLGAPREKLSCMLIPMSMSHKEVDNVYDTVCASIMRDLQKTLSVAVVCIGDAGLYSTFSHLYERMENVSVEIEMIAGVPAFIAAGASAQMPLASGSDRVLVLPDLDNVSDLDRYLELFQTVVFMKLSRFGDKLYSYLERSKKGFVYAEYLGTTREFVTSDLDDLKSRRIPYFALMILFQ